MGIWDQLNTKKLGDRPGTDIDQQTKDIHIQEGNRASLEDTVLIDQASMRDGRPIPGTGIIFQHTQTSTDRAVWFTPEKGEVWKLIVAGSTASSSPAASVTYYLYIQCNDQDGDSAIIYAGSESSGSTEVQLVDFFDSKGDWYVDENMQVQVGVSNMQGCSSFDLKMLAIRVR